MLSIKNVIIFLLLQVKRLQLAPLTNGALCPFKDTIDLSGKRPLENGSYIHENVLISRTQVAEYKFRLYFGNNARETETHLRGCVCGKPKMCVKLCCRHDEFYNEYTFRCERIPKDTKINVYMNIAMDSGKKQRVNIYQRFVLQMGRPCQYLEYLLGDKDLWELKENGELFISRTGDIIDTVSYCLSPYWKEDSKELQLMALSCPILNEAKFSLALNTYAMAISVIFLVPTTLIYLFVGDLSRDIRGKQLISYFISLIGAYSIFSFINISEYVFEDFYCKLLGISSYFFFTSTYQWLSILCYDMLLNFRHLKENSLYRRHTKRFVYYSSYGWGTALLFTLIVIWAQLSDKVPDKFKPGIGNEACWLDTNQWSSAIYFYWPNLIIMLVNVAIFFSLSLHIYRIKHDVAAMKLTKKFFGEYCVIILRLFIVMGISWIMDILSFCLRDFEISDYVFMATDVCNALQGVFIFIIFVLKHNVIQAIRKSCFRGDFIAVNSRERATSS
ncbi:G-protein coupled receptor Mth2 [Musca domestica]|uniref:G-protein coupled receptor Mth2 n=1 Tax=Musca domestica TaxID=7370 RepID=A0ABM3V9C5_MUSDO|nr:G-protein coupled receptor Mth2 [Musca domestica]